MKKENLCVVEANSGQLKFMQSNLHIADYCGVPVRTITTIRKYETEVGKISSSTSGKKTRAEEYTFH